MWETFNESPKHSALIEASLKDEHFIFQERSGYLGTSSDAFHRARPTHQPLLNKQKFLFSLSLSLEFIELSGPVEKNQPSHCKTFSFLSMYQKCFEMLEIKIYEKNKHKT